jgi:DNA-binding NarL/FixJ family response regulator
VNCLSQECQTKGVPNDRKHVEIVSASDSLGPALRLLLEHYDVKLSSTPNATHTDVLIWHFDGKVDATALARVARGVPTLVIADRQQLLRAVDAGCRGFLVDSTPLDNIIEAVDTIAAGGAVVAPDLLGTLLRHVVNRQRRESTNSLAIESLTDREREVFRIAASGASRSRIAEMLFISPETVRTHLQRVYNKLGIHSQAELMSLAVRVGEFDPEEWL